MYRDPDWMLAAFLTIGKQAICLPAANEMATGAGSVVGSTARKSSRALPVHHEGDPRVLLRVEAQRVRRPTPPAKRH
jgi:hypothetical protein